MTDEILKESHWLDRIIEEQATHYGLTTPRFQKLMKDTATYQQLIEEGVIDEAGH